MRTVPINETINAEVTQMRQGEAPGADNMELQDGNMLPRLCAFAGENACAQACQLKTLVEQQSVNDEVGKRCAEQNIVDTLADLHVAPENFVMVSATKDRVIFADQIDDSGATRHRDGYTVVPNANGFYFRPSIDMTPNKHRRINTIAMRMADCGDVVVTGTDRHGKKFLGQAHFSRTNMRGPSASMHSFDSQVPDSVQVSWGEFFIGSGIAHYGADVSQLQVRLVAAVEGKDFLHYYESDEQRDAHFPGWHELGFMRYTGNTDEKGRKECLIDYREMIVWQLTDGIKNPQYRLSKDQIHFEDAINTGDLRLGHASHHAASHGDIAHGRDMYILGLNRREAVAARIAEVERLQAGREWTMRTFGEMSDADYDAFSNLWVEGERELHWLYAAQRALSNETAD